MCQENRGITANMRGRVLALTGAAGGIGSATALLFAQNGARLFLMDRAPLDAVAETCRGAGAEVVCYHGDLALPGAPEQAAEACRQAFGRADVLINNAAIGAGGDILCTSEEDWDLTMRINLRLPFLLGKAFAAKLMIPVKRGVILNMASQAGVVALDDQAAYCVAKAGLMALTRSMAYEWGKHGIRAVALAPTVVETPFALGYWQGERAARHKAQIPAGRFGQPWEVAQACLYLACDAAGLITGTNLMLDGGYTIR